MVRTMVDGAWVIALLPFCASLVIMLLGKRLPGRGAWVGVATLTACFLMSLPVLWHFVEGGHPVERSIHWFTLGAFDIGAGIYVDGLTAVMLLVVTLVSLCVHVYSTGYMRGDRRYTWYFAVLSLFTGSMLSLVLANDFFQLLIGWELVGICSYLLIGHWWEEKENSDAAIKAFITTKTGDVPFLIGVFALTIAAGTANIQEISVAAHHGEIATFTLTAGALLLFGGAIGKSAQFPLHVWLPDAMAGPTPVSALIHAATMVTAGVYLVARVFPIFEGAEAVALQTVGVIACITMLGAALMAMVQDDIKRVLAYSTVSQLAYMFAGLGLGPEGYSAGLFHLFTHAFFKALLFLGAGSIIHAVHSNNMSKMGGLRHKMPTTFWTFLIGTIALMGVPPLAGFWSKDDIIAVAWNTGNLGIWIVGLLTAALTAFYMTRAVILTFFGGYRGDHEAHESPRSMTVPLVALAGLSIFAGFLGAPQFGAVFNDWVHLPFEAAHAPVFHYPMALLSVLIVIGGATVGYRLYRTNPTLEPLLALGSVHTLLVNRFYIDDFYMAFVVKPIQYGIAKAVNVFNRRVLDGIVHAAAYVTRGLSFVVDVFDRRGIDGAVNGIANSADTSGGLLKYVQNGNIQRYAVFLFAGVIALVAFIILI